MADHNYLYYRDIQENDTILVLGATNGDFIRENIQKIKEKNAFVINVEPTPQGCFELSRFIHSHLPNNATLISCALSDKPGIVKLDIRDNLITSSLESRPETNNRWPMTLLYQTNVLCLTLDTLLEAIGKVDMLFCDIEGSELEVFGASKKIDSIPYYAIAAYHMRDGVQTANTMKPMFPNHNITITGEPSYHKHEILFFAQK